jgi:hypothetical protein
MSSKNFYILLGISFFSLHVFSQNVDLQMQKLLANKRIENQTLDIKTGFRIQLYNGMSESRAKSVLEAFSAIFPEVDTKLIYEQPEWKTQTATFKTELEAYKIWIKVREEFTGTFVFEVKKR